MPSLRFIQPAVLVMVGLNVLMVLFMVGVKAVRAAKLAWYRRHFKRIEPALENHIITGEDQPELDALRPLAPGPQLDTLLRHRKMLLNPSYGTVGLLAMPYFFLFEFLGPVIELLGYTAFVAGLLLGILDLEFAVGFFLAAVGLGTLLSIAAVFLEELRLRRYPRWSDLLKLTVYGILENVGYRQTNTAWQVLAIVSFLCKNTDWGAMERQGFDPAKKTTRN